MRSMLIGAGALVLGGALLAPAAADTAITHEATLDGEYATVVVTTGAELAGEWLSVVILEEDADDAAPGAAEIAFIDQRELDDDGALTFRALLPTAELGAYDIVLNTAAGTARYVAPLDGVEDPIEEPSEEPTDGPTEEPTAEPTDGPTDGATEEPTDVPTEEPTDGPTDGATAEPTDGATGGAGDGDAADSDGDGAGDSGSEGSAGGGTDAGSGSAGDTDGRLSQTGAPVVAAVVLALAAIIGGVLLRVRRHRVV